MNPSLHRSWKARAGRFCLASATLLIAGLTPDLTHAQTVLLHTGYNTVQPRPWQDDQGNWWNRPTTWGVGTWSNLVDTENHATAISYQTTAMFSSYTSGPASGDLLDYPDFVSQNSFVATTHSPAGRFSGLDSTKTYTITFYAAQNLTNFVTQQGLDITVTGESTASGSLLLTGPVGQAAYSELTFENLRPAEDGTLSIAYTIASGFSRGTLNAISITAIPEPGAVLLGIGGLVMLVSIRRRKSSLRK